MARKARDYAAEQRRRNELARQRGFTSRGSQRRAIEAGRAPAIKPALVRSPKTVAAQRKLAEATQLDERFLKQATANEAYSQAHANRNIAKYLPAENALPGVSTREYTDAYYQAFVNPKTGYDKVRRRGGSAALRRYFVNITGHFTADEYETRYGHTR